MFALVLRTAQAMELHDEASLMKLSPFEAEMRRRLYWQIVVLDAFYVEIRGHPPIVFEEMYDTRQPLNLPDEQLDPMSGIIGAPQSGPTEMTFSLLSQSASLLMETYSSMNPRNKKLSGENQASLEKRAGLILQRCREIKTRYIDVCDPSVPVLWSTAETGRIIILRFWLLSQRPMFTLRRQTAKPAKRELVLAAALSVVEIVDEVEHHPSMVLFFWYMQGYIPWYAIAIILAELCVQTKGPLVDRAWRMIENTVEVWGKRADAKTAAFWQPMRKMLDKAKQVRAENSQSLTDAPQNNQMMSMGAPFSEEADKKQLHFAAVAMALGDADELEALLSMPKLSPPQAMDQSLPTDDFGAPIDWDDWDNFIQTTIDANGNDTLPLSDASLQGDFAMMNSQPSYEIPQTKDPQILDFNFIP